MRFDGSASPPTTSGPTAPASASSAPVGCRFFLNEGQAKWTVQNVEQGYSVCVEAWVGESSYSEGDDRKYTTDIIATTFNLLTPSNGD